MTSTQIDGRLQIQSGTVLAEAVPISDLGLFYTGSHVESALQEIGAEIFATGSGNGLDDTYLRLDATNDPITGDLLLKPASNSIATLQIQQLDSTVIFNVDTVSGNVSIAPTISDSKLYIEADSSFAALTVVQSGTGDIFSVYDGTKKSFIVVNEGTEFRLYHPTTQTRYSRFRHNGNLIIEGGEGASVYIQSSENATINLLPGGGSSSTVYISNTNSVTRISGKVGIGTSTSPSQRLEVNGNIKFTADALLFQGSGDLSLRAKVNLRLGAGNVDSRMVIDASGNIVIYGDLLFEGSGSGLAFGAINIVGNGTETAIASQNVYVQITVFDTNGESNNSTPDHTNDHITITKPGRYSILCTATVNSIGGSGSTAELEVKKNNGNTRVGSLHVDRTLAGGGSESGAVTMTDIVSLAVDDTIEVWIKNETNTQNYVVEDITLSLVQIGG